MEFRILGPLEVSGSEGPLPLGGAKQRALLALGRVALAHELDPSPLNLVVDHDELRSLWDFFAVARLPKFAVLRELKKRSVHSHAVRGQVSRDGRAAICKRRLSRWDDDALLFTLLFEF